MSAVVLAVVSSDGAIAHATSAPIAGSDATPVAATISVNPRSISFRSKAFADSGAMSEPVKVTVTNQVGGKPITFSKPTISDGFVVTSDACVGELPPGKSCDLEIAFAPTALGVQHGKLRINSNAANGRRAVKLRGRGVAPAIKIKPKSLNFGHVSISKKGPARSVTLTNPSRVPITLAVAPAATPPYNVTANTCEKIAADGGTCTISVEFDPDSRGEFKGRLQIRDNGARSPQHVELFGIAK